MRLIDLSGHTTWPSWSPSYAGVVIDIREATAADADAVVGLEASLFVEDSGVYEPHADVSWPAREGHADFEQLISCDDGFVVLAWDGDDAIGLVMAYAATASSTKQPVRYAVLRTMYVATSHRRHGVGGLLVDRFLEWARSIDCVEAQVNHYVDNEPAGALYEAHGFMPHSLNRVVPLR